MIKKTVLWLLLVGSIIILVAPGAVQATDLSVTDSSVEVDFPGSITFNISAASDADITDIRLHYISNRLEHARIVSEIYLEFMPFPRVTEQWVWDMRMTGGLPPGASLEYWWTVADAAGNTLETALASLRIEDDRYNWRSITQGKVTLYWYEGDEAFAAGLMTAAQDALARLEANTGAEIESPVSFYIYVTSVDLRGSMIFPQEWTGGVAFNQYGIIAIGIGTSNAEVEWGKGTIAHELSHLVVNQLTFNPYNDLPTWLDEGLAMFAEGELDAQFTRSFDWAKTQNALASVRSLASPFSAFGSESVLSYAESYEIVKYLIDTYGQEKMFELLSTFRQGCSYDDALNKVYGLDMDGLNTQWQASLGIVTDQPVVEEGIPPAVEEGMPPAVTGLIAGLIAVIFLLLSLLTETWAWRRGW